MTPQRFSKKESLKLGLVENRYAEEAAEKEKCLSILVAQVQETSFYALMDLGATLNVVFTL